MPQRLHPYIRDLNPGLLPPLPVERSMDLRYSRAQIDDMFLEDLGIQVCDSARLLGAPIGDLLSAYADHSSAIVPDMQTPSRASFICSMTIDRSTSSSTIARQLVGGSSLG